MDPDLAPEKAIEVDPDPDLDQGSKWIQHRIQPNVVDQGRSGSSSGSKTLVHSFFLSSLDSVFQHKMAIFDYNPFVHNLFLASKLHNFVSYSSIHSTDSLTWGKNVVLMKILKIRQNFIGFPAWIVLLGGKCGFDKNSEK